MNLSLGMVSEIFLRLLTLAPFITISDIIFLFLLQQLLYLVSDHGGGFEIKLLCCLLHVGGKLFDQRLLFGGAELAAVDLLHFLGGCYCKASKSP